MAGALGCLHGPRCKKGSRHVRQLLPHAQGSASPNKATGDSGDLSCGVKAQMISTRVVQGIGSRVCR